MKFLWPDIYARNIRVIPYEELLKNNIDTLIFDIDNTLVPYDISHANEDLTDFLEKLKDMGFKICLLSNNNKKRVDVFNENFSFFAVWDARKPTSYGLKKALKLMNSRASQSALIGDQIFTDIWCANRSKLKSILIKPVNKKDTFGVYLKRGFESIIVKSFIKNAKKNK
ncbi:MAG: YqeG family HAD IIIA-type phosphatase [Defluviitaleaceae bacterium]|nr:YqeG family HAD IIIA-type phosphatase [Defluviitaleaceae bacterium]